MTIDKIAIVGFTAAGKSEHAGRLAVELGWTVYSVSDEIEKLTGVNVRQKDFWLTPEGRELQQRVIELGVDEHLVETARNSSHVVFDCRSLPWLYTEPDLFSIWLGSDLESRAKKAAVSNLQFESADLKLLAEAIHTKDLTDRNSFLQLGFDYFADPCPADLTIDISGFITAATAEASGHSIRQAHEIVSCAARCALGYESTDRLQVLRTYHGDGVFLAATSRRL